MVSPVITDELVEDHLRCVTKSYLRLQGQSGQTTDYLALDAQLAATYRGRASEAVAARCQTACVRREGAAVPDLGTGEALILDVTAEADGLKTHFDGLSRVPGESRLGAFHYRPLRFCPRSRPDAAVVLLLAFDALVLGRLQGRTPEDGALVYGTSFKQVRVRLGTHLDALAPVLDHLRLQTAAVDEPPLMLNRHCDACEFRARCRAKAVETDHLTLLRGMTPAEVVRHNAHGIFTVNQLSYTFRPRKPRARGEGQRNPHSHALQALSLREKRVHVHGDPGLALPPVRAYLDVEGLPDRDFYYLVGVLVVTTNSAEYQSFWADDETMQEAAFVGFADLMARHPGCELFHYGSYEANALRHMAAQVPEAYREPLKAMSAKGTNVLAVINPHIYFPTTSNGLKDVAGYLGFRWTQPNASGQQSIVWRERWEGSRDPALRETLIQYNREDCLALQRVTEFAASVACERTKETPGGQGAPAEVVYTADRRPAASGRFKWGCTEFCLPEFEFVNKCAYFDYQRERASARPDGRARRPGKTVQTARRPRRVRMNRRVELRCERCPGCNSKKIEQRRALSLRYIDLKFFRGGVKRWVTAYSSWSYRCTKCGQTFRPPGYPDFRMRYGEGLRSWALYQNAACGQNMQKVGKCLREVFDLDVPPYALNRFKAAAAERYRPTAEAVLAGLLRGPSLHVDETGVRLRQDSSGHVWVFAGPRGAYYQYRETRDGQFLGGTLKGFSGVLVTDFFTAYDSIDCPQQKCLIHLIRDMNEDLERNAFDTELRGIIQRFAALLRSIVETIDRYGLTKSRLQRHKAPALAFVEAVARERPSSPAAAKYQKRVDRYGTRMFTFLDYDNVPWNNNNAENAIKSFARCRQIANGRFTKKSVADYLTILSISQTCEYRGLNVLKFLRSGATCFEGDSLPTPPISPPGGM